MQLNSILLVAAGVVGLAAAAPAPQIPDGKYKTFLCRSCSFKASIAFSMTRNMTGIQ